MRSVRTRAATLAGVAILIFFADASPEGSLPPGNPLLVASTLLGGSDHESAAAAVLGPDGVLWFAGSSSSTDFPGAPREAGEENGGDVVVLRYDLEARTVLSAAWIGSTYSDRPVGLAVDGDGNVFVAGSTDDAASFPVTAGIPRPAGWSHCAFVARLKTDGTGFVWSAVVGGAGWDDATGLALTAAGDPVICGTTASTDFPTVDALRGEMEGNRDAFVACLKADGSDYVFSTYLGGSDLDDATAITVAPGGGILVAGYTNSTDSPADERLLGEPSSDFEGFLAELTPGAAGIRRAVLLGGTSVAAVDARGSGSLLLLGRTTEEGFPAAFAPHGAPGDDADAYLLRIDDSDWEVLDGALFGGSLDEYYLTMATDPAGVIWVAGSTKSPDLPLSGAIRPLLGSSEDLFVAAFGAGDLRMLFSTYLGGDARDYAGQLFVTGDGSAWLSGGTWSEDFPVVGPPPAGGGENDLFLARFSIGDPGARPLAPAGFAAEVLGGNAVRLSWEDRSGGVAGFAVYREDTEGFARVAVLDAGTTDWVDETVMPDHGYTWAVQAVTAAGGSPATDPVEARTPGTLDVTVERASWRYWPGYFEGTTRLRLRGHIAANDGSIDGTLDPPTEGVEFVSDALDPETAVDPKWLHSDLVSIPADDPGWRIGRRRARWKGKGVTFRVDPRTGKNRLKVRVYGWLPVREENLALRVTVGDDSGSTALPWRKVGHRRGRIP